MSVRSSFPNYCSRAIERVLCVAFIGLGALGAQGQKAPELDQLIRFEEPLSATQEKYVHEGIQGQEAGAQVWVDRPLGQVKVRAHVVLDRVSLQAGWTPLGMRIVYLGPIIQGQPGDRVDQPVSPVGFPVFVDTGDAASDNAAYEAAKASWIAAHPKEYGSLNENTQPE